MLRIGLNLELFYFATGLIFNPKSRKTISAFHPYLLLRNSVQVSEKCRFMLICMDRFVKYYKKRLGSVVSILTKPKGKFSTKDFHKVRIEIRKIKALTCFLNYCTNTSIKKASVKPYANIFDRAGKVRELQLGIAFLKRLKLLGKQSGLARSLKKRLKKEKSAFFSIKYSGLYRKMKKNYRKVFSLSSALNNDYVDRFWNLKNSEINELLKPENLERNQIHDLRKRLKELCFVGKLIPSAKSKYRNIKGFLKLLGDWHDSVVFESSLQKAIDIGNLASNEIVTVENLKVKVHAENEQMFKQINSKKLNYFPTVVDQH